MVVWIEVDIILFHSIIDQLKLKIENLMIHNSKLEKKLNSSAAHKRQAQNMPPVTTAECQLDPKKNPFANMKPSLQKNFWIEEMQQNSDEKDQLIKLLQDQNGMLHEQNQILKKTFRQNKKAAIQGTAFNQIVVSNVQAYPNQCNSSNSSNWPQHYHFESSR